jgi:hypothetical protein
MGSLLVDRKATDFCTLIFYSAVLMNFSVFIHIRKKLIDSFHNIHNVALKTIKFGKSIFENNKDSFKDYIIFE